MLDLEPRFIMWWRINVFGRLYLGEFLRFALKHDDHTVD